jgi:putative transposase
LWPISSWLATDSVAAIIRQGLAMEVDQSIKPEQTLAVLDHLKQRHGWVPEPIKVDNDSEFISKALDN